MTPMQTHLAAINAGEVTKTNVIGLRKALNHVARLRAGWSGNRSSATAADADAILASLAAKQPRVIGELHDSGVRVLTNKRYAKRWTANHAAVIAGLQGFRLVDFYEINRAHVTPVYLATGAAGSFQFVNIPWQSGGDGPLVIR